MTSTPISPLRGLGPVLLSSKGAGGTAGATLLAGLIAEHLHRGLQVVTVIEPVALYAGSNGLTPIPVVVDESLCPVRERSVRQLVDGLLPPGTRYALDIRYGPVSHEISSCAREVDACALVVGAGPERKRARVLSGVLAAQLLRTVHAPVISVVPALDHLPREVVVGVDFSGASVRAAREALALVEPGGRLTLAYAIPMVHAERLAPTLASVIGPEESLRRLEQLRDRLQRSTTKRCTIDVRVMDGVADDSILQLAESLGADLIAVGTHGPGLFERIFIGSTATHILHLSQCSVLAVGQSDDADDSWR